LAVGLYLDSDPRSLIDASYEPDVDTTKKPAAAPADAEKIPSTSSGDTMAAKGNQAVDNDELKKLNIVPFFGFLRGGKGRLKILSILMSLDRLLFTRNKNGQGEAHGDCTFKLGWLRYKGEMQKGKINGKGTMKSGRRRYTGAWKDNTMHGVGTYKWPNGSTYAGGFKKNKMHGRGTLKQAHGFVVEGYWKNGNFVGRADPDIDTTAAVVEGYCKNGNFVGKADKDYGSVIGTAAETLTLPEATVGIPVSGSGTASTSKKNGQ
ncbi:hypothetical protein THAOC_08432, partial [Thalassiosira oceanica]